jgi:L-threonylcarbamoyladenylate synthase
MDGRAVLVLDAGNVEIGVESTVVDLTGREPLLLRPGGTARERLEAFLGERVRFPGEGEEEAKRRSPGTRYRHYAPAVPVRVWRRGEALPEGVDPALSGFVGLSEGPAAFAWTLAFGSEEDYARGLFAAFRELEAKPKCRHIVAEWPGGEGIGLALRDRIRRASGEGA